MDAMPPDAHAVYSTEYVAKLVNQKQTEAYAEGRKDEREHMRSLLLASLDDKPESEWQPIDTAPRESERLILAEDGRVFYGHWVNVPFREFRDMAGVYIGQQDPEAFWMDDRDGSEVNPTHWHPHPLLPDPPKVGEPICRDLGPNVRVEPGP